MKLLFCSFLFITAVYAQQSANQFPISLDDLVVEVSGPSQDVVFGNQTTGVFYTETKGIHRFPWQGFRAMGKEMLKDYSFRIDDLPLRREDAVRMLVSPYQLTRFYPNGVEESIIMVDSVNAFVVELKNVRGKNLVVYPMFSEAMNDTDYYALFERNVMMIGRTNHPVRTTKEDYPATIAFSFANELYSAAGFYESKIIGSYFSPAYVSTVKLDSLHRLVFGIGDSIKHAYEIVKLTAKNYAEVVDKQRQRMQQLINDFVPSFEDHLASIAFAWAIIGTDKLLLTDYSPKTFLELPLAEDGKLKQVVSATPCAGLIFGDNDKSKLYLRSLASQSLMDSNNLNHGQILCKPLSGSSINVMPWFTLVLQQYGVMTHDTNTVKELFPAVRRGIEGALKFHTEKNFLLKQSTIESQLTLLAPFELRKRKKKTDLAAQALWLKQLSAGISLAKLAGDKITADKWEKIQQKVMKVLK